MTAERKHSSGGCMCGAVRFKARDVPSTFGICHCEMCRRWTGSAFLEVCVPEGSVTWSGAEHIATLKSSDWAERAWCRECGSTLYFKVTQEGAYFGNLDIALGLFDDAGEFTLSHEIYIDQKPASFAYAGPERITLTRQQCIEKFGVPGDTR